jgi:hypothetical protein
MDLVCAILSYSIYGPVLNNEKNLFANLLNVLCMDLLNTLLGYT